MSVSYSLRRSCCFLLKIKAHLVSVGLLQSSEIISVSDPNPYIVWLSHWHFTPSWLCHNSVVCSLPECSLAYVDHSISACLHGHRSCCDSPYCMLGVTCTMSHSAAVLIVCYLPLQYRWTAKAGTALWLSVNTTACWCQNWCSRVQFE